VPDVVEGVLAGVLDAGVLAGLLWGVLVVSEVLGDAALVVASPVLPESLAAAVDVAPADGADEVPLRLSVL